MSKKIIIPNENEIKIFGGKSSDDICVSGAPEEDEASELTIGCIFDKMKDLDKIERVSYVSEPSFIGQIPARQEIEILPADPVKNLSLGWAVHEIVGIGICNPSFLSKVILDVPWQDTIEDIINEQSNHEE